LLEEADLAPDGFPELVEQTRQAINEVCLKAKLVLRWKPAAGHGSRSGLTGDDQTL